MNKKIIKSILTKRFNEFAESITNEDVRKLVRENSIITGGAITSLLLNEQVKDYDVYFTNKETTKAVANYYCDIFNQKHKKRAQVIDGADPQSGLEPNAKRNLTEDRIKIYISSDGIASEDDEFLSEPAEDLIEKADDIDSKILEEGDKFRPVFLSPNAITLSGHIQLIIRFYGNADEIHKNYDFVHCTNYWESRSKSLTFRQDALESILTKELRYVGSKYPVCSVIRTRKFIKRGWHINAGQYLKMLFQTSSLNLRDIDVLNDQLVGVDTAYFNILINALSKKFSDTGEVDTSYAVSIIDRIF